MSQSFTACNMVSSALKNIPRNNNRRYLAVVASTLVTVTISSGESFDIAAGGVWSPLPAPINDIKFSGNGTLILG